MPRVLILSLRSGGLLLLLMLAVFRCTGQSRYAYLQAGDACLEKQDPFCAIGYYRQALEYGDDASTFFSLAKAEKALFNYAACLDWIRRAMPLCSDPQEREALWRMAADVNKRSGNFSAAMALLDSLRLNYPTKVPLIDSLRRQYEIARQHASDSLPLEALLLAGDINSAYSDFAPALVGDTLLLYSSMRYQTNDKKAKTATSRIAASTLAAGAAPKSVLLPESINQPSFNDANASVSPDGKVMVFTRCLYNSNGQLICGLYESVFKNGKWEAAARLTDQINNREATTTQPCLATNKADGYLLFFSSNRPGGAGGMDIWWTRRNANGNWEKPVNAGQMINTERDEWSPFFDVVSSSLYFSCERDAGFGGLDLYRTNWTMQSCGLPEHLPKPYNSGYNDLYYTRSYGENTQEFLVSNRPPATRLNGSSCCYDIFQLAPLPAAGDTSPVLAANTISPLSGADVVPGHPPSQETFNRMSTEEQANVLNFFFPIRLYFDNDQPDPRSLSRTTNTHYDDLAIQYLNREEEYLQRQASPESRPELITFFNDSVRWNLIRLESFSNLLEGMLQRYEGRVKITITGSASPLADKRYNVILSNRRIVSLENYWNNRVGGRLQEALSRRRLLLEFIPAGEEKAAAAVSDDDTDLSRSVFSRAAALERRIELTAIELIP